MATSFHLPSLQTPLLNKSNFLGQNNFSNFNHKSSFPIPKQSSNIQISAKFDLFEILGGRGLCNGEEGIQELLKKSIPQSQDQETSAAAESVPEDIFENAQNTETSRVSVESIPEDGFEKELLGLTGGFPGGEKGLQKFIEKNPPPKKSQASASVDFDQNQMKKKKAKPPELPLLLPGMIVIVKNEKNPFYMYSGIVQRITDGKAGVLFEGGNWDRLVTFKLDELERREKGPPMVNPKSAVLETMLENSA